MAHTPEPQYRSWQEIVAIAANQAAQQIDERTAVRLAHIFAAFEFHNPNGVTPPSEKPTKE
jgi:hypothetical protein